VHDSVLNSPLSQRQEKDTFLQSTKAAFLEARLLREHILLRQQAYLGVFLVERLDFAS
jgi:hypothetical protein